MKVFFAPNYFYLNLPVFEQVINKLKEKGIFSYIFRLPGNTNISADSIFDLKYFESKGLKVFELPLKLVPNYKNSFASRINLIILAFQNMKIIREMLLKRQPDVVVVGSDLGNLHIRFLIDACYLYYIPIVILYTCDVPEYTNKNIFRFFYSLKNKYIFKSNFLSFLRALLFTGATPGEYAINSKICVSSEDICQKLISRGIDKSRIFVTGMPFLTSPINSLENIFEKLNISKDYRLIVFFTECIQNIYGVEYTKDLYIKLGEIIKNLPEDIFFIIKLHPLESKEMKAFIKNIFNKPQYEVIEDFNVEELISISDLCIAHFSRVLIIVALMGKRFLSINLMKDRKRTFISNEESEILEINSNEEFKKKIYEALENSEYGQKIDKTITCISNRFYSSDSIDKITSVVLNIVSQ